MISRRIIAVSFVVLAAVVGIAYYPAINAGFRWDDWLLIETLGRLGPWEYLLRSFDFRQSFLFTYRPLQGAAWFIQYLVFGVNPVGYHFVMILLHAFNAMMLIALVWRISQRKRIAIMSGLIFASLPIYGMSVFLPATTDAWAIIFYFLGIWWWLSYLETKKEVYRVGVLVAFVCGLFQKETVVSLPFVLWGLDAFCSRISVNNFVDRIKPYLSMILLAVVYLVFRLAISANTSLSQIYGMSLGSHILTNTAQYLSGLFFPWLIADLPTNVLGLVGLLLFVIVVPVRKSWMLLFLGIIALANILPVVMFRERGAFSFRFLYISTACTAIVLARLIEIGARFFRQRAVRLGYVALIAVLFLFLNPMGVSQAAQQYADEGRAERTTLRDVTRLRPTLPPDTFLYFIAPPPRAWEFSGMFFTRYGMDVTVSTTLHKAIPGLRTHRNAFIYVLDPAKSPTEVRVQKDVAFKQTPNLPANFEISIQLEAIEVSSQSLKPGENLVLLLFWRAAQRIDKDYTIFVHLIAPDGRLLASQDGQPRNGESPTSSWVKEDLVVDWVVMQLGKEIIPGKGNRLEIGLYDAGTMQTLAIVDQNGMPITDRITIEPIDLE